MMKPVLFAAILTLGGASAAAAQEGFQSPTGNIMCAFFDDTVRCDVMRMSNNPPPRPADCDLDWGQAFEVSANARRGYRLCYGDTVAGNYRKLGYGKSITRAGITCASSQAGVTCTNGRGAGFSVSRGKQRVF